MIFQLINGPIHRLGNCQDQLLIDASGVVDCAINPPLGNSDHSSISFVLQLGFCTSSITFSHQVYLKSHVDWSRVYQNLQESIWGDVYNSPDSANAFNN